MTFLHVGIAAAGMAAVSIPILIHLLLRQRRRPLEWGAMRFLIEAYRRQRNRLRLQHLILLALRCLIVALVGLALARPILERAGVLASGGRDVYLLIDTGLASSTHASDGEQAIERLRRSARSVLDALGPGDRAGLVTMGAPVREVVVPASADIGAVRKLVNELTPSEGATHVANAIDAMADRLRAEGAKASRRSVAVVLSEFRAGSLDMTAPVGERGADRLEGVTMLALTPATERVANVQVVSVEPLRQLIVTGEGRGAAAGGARVTLRRLGADLTEGQLSTVRLRVWNAAEGPGGGAGGAGPVVAQEVVPWNAGEAEATVTLSFDVSRLSPVDGAADTDASSSVAFIVEIDRDPTTGDNIYRRPVRVLDAIDIGVVARRRFGAGPAGAASLTSADWVRMALAPRAVSPVLVQEIEPDGLDIPVLAALDALVIAEPHLLDDPTWKRVRRFADNGGLIMLWPAEDEDIHPWAATFTQHMGLDWTLAREATTFDQPARLSREIGDADILGLLAGEMVDLASPVGVDRVLTADALGQSTRVLLRLEDGTPWVFASPPGGGESNGSNGRGMIVFLASPPAIAWTDLPARPLMVPLIHETLRQGLGEGWGDWIGVVGEALASEFGVQRLEEVGGAWSVDLGVTSARRVAERSGLARAIDANGRARGVIAVNADVRGGDTTVQNTQAVSDWFAALAPESATGGWKGFVTANNAGASLVAASSGTGVGFFLLVAALALGVIETALARLFSYAERAPALVTPALGSPA